MKKKSVDKGAKYNTSAASPRSTHHWNDGLGSSISEIQTAKFEFGVKDRLQLFFGLEEQLE